MEKESDKVDIEYKRGQAIDCVASANKKNIEGVNETLAQLRYLLGTISIDEEKTLFGSEPVLKNTFNDVEQKKIKDKIFELMLKM